MHDNNQVYKFHSICTHADTHYYCTDKQRERKHEDIWHKPKPLTKLSRVSSRGSQVIWQLTFALEALFSQDADKGQELGDLFQVQHSGVVELHDGHGLLVISTAAAILLQTSETQQNTVTFKEETGNKLQPVYEVINCA